MDEYLGHVWSKGQLLGEDQLRRKLLHTVQGRLGTYITSTCHITVRFCLHLFIY